MRDGAPFSCIPYPHCSPFPPTPNFLTLSSALHLFYCSILLSLQGVFFTGFQNLALALTRHSLFSSCICQRISYTILMDYVHGRQLRSVNIAVSLFFLLSPSLRVSSDLFLHNTGHCLVVDPAPNPLPFLFYTIGRLPVVSIRLFILSCHSSAEKKEH